MYLKRNQMYKFSKTSQARLDTCHPKLKQLFEEVIKVADITIVSGMRTPEEQLELYKQGRTEPGNIVTNLDGYNKKSKHNENPSLAVDVVPYPVDWNDIDRFIELSHTVKTLAHHLGIEIQWGGDWKTFKDYPHWQLK
jgi:peptidoglycan L-alanyl-D-glutamate endopeptidase CwlK